MGCLGWGVAGLARLALIFVWIFTSLVPRAFDGGFWGWAWPIIGILFAPFTVLTYVIVNALAGGVTGWAWLWIVLAFLADISAHQPAIRVTRTRTSHSHDA
jgi:hypothetical protein